MPISNTLKQQASAQGITIVELVRRTLLETKSTLKAAQKLNCAPNTIRYWMKKGDMHLVISADVYIGA